MINPRLKSALRYLKWADPIYKWQVNRSLCPNCNGKLFISFRKDAFMTRCLSCGSNIINLSLIPVIKLHAESHQINTAWEMSTYGATLNYLKKNIPNVIQSEFFPGVDSGNMVNNILNQDVQNLSFENESIDLITSNQVFEHVPDDILGFKECFRVLRRKGALIFSIPLYDIPHTEMLAENINNELVFHTEPEYHDSRTAGPRSALTFWHHSIYDISDRIRKAQFNVSILDITLPALELFSTKVIYAVKT